MENRADHSKGDMSGDGRIDVSPDGKRLLLSIDMGEESGRKDWDAPVASALSVRSPIAKGDQANAKKLFGWDGVLDRQRHCSLSQPASRAKRTTQFIKCPLTENLKRLIKNGRFPSVSAPSSCLT